MTGLVVLLVLVGIILAMQSEALRVFKVISESMEPTLKVGDRILVDGQGYAERFDVISFQDPEKPNQPKEQLIKRIVGVQSDLVEIEGGILYINGEEQYSRQVTTNSLYWRDVRQVVPPGHVFVLGDNRNNSYDSLNFGPVPIENITGILRFILWPPDDWGRVPDYED